MIEGSTTYDTFKDLVDMAPDKSSIIRATLFEVPLLCIIDMEEYVLEHQGIHRSMMKADPQAKTEASTSSRAQNKVAKWYITGATSNDELSDIVLGRS